MEINRNLIWDYSFTLPQMQTEEFKRWYIARVLMRGGIEDIRAIGTATIRKYLPDLCLPRSIREFWEWHFASPEPPKA